MSKRTTKYWRYDLQITTKLISGAAKSYLRLKVRPTIILILYHIWWVLKSQKSLTTKAWSILLGMAFLILYEYSLLRRRIRNYSLNSSIAFSIHLTMTLEYYLYFLSAVPLLSSNNSTSHKRLLFDKCQRQLKLVHLATSWYNFVASAHWAPLYLANCGNKLILALGGFSPSRIFQIKPKAIESKLIASHLFLTQISALLSKSHIQ
jgi:hypothetical protein